jgi:chorismate mutase
VRSGSRLPARHGHTSWEYKLAHNLPPVAPERENRQLERIRNIASQAGLEPGLAQGILEFIIREVVARHRNLKPESEPAHDIKILSRAGIA